MSIVNFFTHTPWWVYLIFLYCLWVGYIGSRERTFNVKKALIIPILFIWMSYDSLHKFPGSYSLNFNVTAIGWIFGVVIGIFMAKYLKPQVVDKAKLLIKTRGSWMMMVTIILIFAVKYYEGYLLATQSALLAKEAFRLGLLLIAGIVTGTFIGRAIVYFYVLKKG